VFDGIDYGLAHNGRHFETSSQRILNRSFFEKRNPQEIQICVIYTRSMARGSSRISWRCPGTHASVTEVRFGLNKRSAG
jgi:hypothetical protein